jgi:hypothetical protein
MARSVATLLLMVAVVTVVPLSAARADESPTAEQARRAAEVRKKLAATVNFSGFDDPEVKLEEALQHLTKLYDVTFEINDQAFRDEMIDNVADKPLGKAIPKMTGVPLETVLRRILARIPAPSGTTYIVRGGIAEITTRHYASPSQWRREQGAPDEVGSNVPPPETSVAFDKREVREALREIAGATGVNIVVDARAQAPGKTPVTVTLQNVAVDTVVRLLADMADLEAVLVDDVFYVTTKENVQAVRKEQEKRRAAVLGVPAAVMPGLGGLAAPFALPDDIQRQLKEHEEEIRRLKDKLKDKQPPEKASQKGQ